MIEDNVLKLRFKLGSEEALRRIYEKYLNTMLGVAMAFLNDVHASEDVVHDVFVSLAQSAGDFRLTGSLKYYLITCVANRARDRLRSDRRRAGRLGPEAVQQCRVDPPEEPLILAENAQRVYRALSMLPPEQREVVTLRIKAGMKLTQTDRSYAARSFSKRLVRSVSLRL